jgi:hypothetical protein
MRFEDGDVAGLDDDLILSQLASIRYSHNSRGQVVIESKEQARERGVKPPDRAEALMLAFADRTSGIFHYYKAEAERAAAYRPVQQSAAAARGDGRRRGRRHHGHLPQGARRPRQSAQGTIIKSRITIQEPISTRDYIANER